MSCLYENITLHIYCERMGDPFSRMVVRDTAILPENAIVLRTSFLRRSLEQTKTNVNCWAFRGGHPGPKEPYWPWPALPGASPHTLPIAQGPHFSSGPATQPCPEKRWRCPSALTVAWESWIDLTLGQWPSICLMVTGLSSQPDAAV